MNSIIYVGMDVHKESFTLSCFSVTTQETFATVKISPDVKAIKKYLDGVRLSRSEECEFVCGYEAGCLGYTLYHQLTAMNIRCVIMAPTTILRNGKRVKTDRIDAENLARCLAYGGYKSVYIPTAQDEAVRDYLRMRDDHKLMLKKIKQQINAFNEYMITSRELADKVERLESQIEQLAELEEYRDKVKKLICIKGIKTHTALSLIVEAGDFSRFQFAERYASYIGLVPGEHSSSEDRNRLGITKAGNRHMRMLLTEAAQCYSRGVPAKKSKDLKSRQKGAPPNGTLFLRRYLASALACKIKVQLSTKKRSDFSKAEYFLLTKVTSYQVLLFTSGLPLFNRMPSVIFFDFQCSHYRIPPGKFDLFRRRAL